MTTAEPLLGLLAGAGRYPLSLLREARQRGFAMAAVSIEGVSVTAVDREASPCLRLRVGQLAETARFFRGAGVRSVILAGGVPWKVLTIRPRLDWYAVRALAAGLVGDDRLLRQVAAALEGFGLEVVEPGELASGLVAQAGWQTGPSLPDRLAPLVEQAWDSATTLGRRDRGQAAVAFDDIVLVEDRHGTDRLLRRAGRLRRRGGVLAKVAKPDQDRRFDLPALGPATVTAAARTGVEAMVIQAGAGLVIDRDEVETLATRLGVSVVALENP